MADPSVITDALGRFFDPDEPPSWLIDVGVGGGTEANNLKNLWPNLKVIGLEPNRALWPADYPGEILPYGAWSHARDHTLWLAGPRDTSSSLFERVPVVGALATTVRPLDELLRKYPDLNRAILWADVEGAELEALRGAWKLLQTGVIVLCNLEVRTAPLGPGACTEADVNAFLAGFGFVQTIKYNVHGGSDPHADAVYVKSSRARTW